jgi:hypothetical protein
VCIIIDSLLRSLYVGFCIVYCLICFMYFALCYVLIIPFMCFVVLYVLTSISCVLSFCVDLRIASSHVYSFEFRLSRWNDY